MGGNKRRRGADDKACASTAEDDGSEDGVLAQLEPRAAGGGDAEIRPAWPLDFLQHADARAPAAIVVSDNVPSVENIGRHIARRTLERMQRRQRKKSKKREVGDAPVVTPTPIQLRLWPALLRSFELKESPESSDPVNAVGIAPTGSGKTMAYCIPLAAHCARMLLQHSRDEIPQTHATTRVHGLVLVPTRELAIQVAKEYTVAAKVANKYLTKCAPDAPPKVESVAVYGGVDMESQIKALLGRQELPGQRSLLVAATAGRLLDILQQSEPAVAAFANLQAVVFDEADRTAVNGDMAGQVDEILEMLKTARANSGPKSADVVTCLVSATLPEKAREMCEKWVPRSRVVVKVGSVNVGGTAQNAEAQVDEGSREDESTAMEPSSKLQADAPKGKHLPQNLDLAGIPAHIVQTLHVCASHKKPKKLVLTLQRLYARKEADGGRFSANNRLCVVFFAQIKTLKYLAKLLAKEERIPRCVELHGSLNQVERERRLLEFKAGKTPILLATDVAARGLHVPNVHYVVCYDFPGSLDQYVHRCGRAGRKPSALSGTQHPPTVYSFFTREMAAMADSVVELLRKCNAWIDPNLLALTKEEKGLSEKSSNKSGRKRKRGKKESSKDAEKKKAGAEKKRAGAEGNVESDDDEADPFAFLGKSALKRASHVSDAEEDSDDDSS
ncbi:hypothetical protein ACHAXT_009155 [Thalassiosira profunda]